MERRVRSMVTDMERRVRSMVTDMERRVRSMVTDMERRVRSIVTDMERRVRSMVTDMERRVRSMATEEKLPITRSLLAAICIGTSAFAADTPSVTFNRDVLPILQKNCQTCHRPGEIAPMPFLTYRDARPYAKAIKAAVLTHKMPPWFADPAYGHWANAPKLTAGDIQTLAAWADNGAAEGDAKPAPVDWPQGWSIKPDLIVKMPKPFHVPAKGAIEITSFTLPTGLTKDTWITSIEVRPGNRRVVHHVAVSFRPHDASVKYGEPRAQVELRDENGDQIGRVRKLGLGNFTGLEAVFLPGSSPLDFRVHNAAKLIPAGYDIVLQMHYASIGEDAEDQTEVGFTVAKEEPARRFVTLSPAAARDERTFRIPAGDPNWEISTEVEFNQDAEIVWFLPHMHLRGKDMTYQLEFPTGEKQVVLSVPRYDFNWQMGYEVEKPIKVPKGTRLLATAHYDKSANNKFNPNPNKDVWWGDQTWEEMMVAWFGVIVDKSSDPRKVVTYTPKHSGAAWRGESR